MQNSFNLDENIIHLNHAAVAPWPVATRHTVCSFAEENVRIGSQHYNHWLKTETGLRQQLAHLINADSTDEIAILKNTSEGLSVVAQGLQWQQGDNIVIPVNEFPSNRIVWQALEEKGVETRQVTITDPAQAEQQLINAMDNKTRLLSCSSVSYASGLRLDLEMLGQACKQRKSLFCVDAIQSLGAIRFDVKAVQADFVVADGHKWMCGPEGTALFYCRSDIMEHLQPRQFGWHMVENPHDFEQEDWKPAGNAKRFECGSPNMLGIAALHSSLGVLFKTGLEAIENQVLTNSLTLFEALDTINGIEVLSSRLADRYAGIVTFRHKHIDNEQLYQHLQENNVICAMRGGGIRFSPHFHTRTDDMARAIEHVREFKSA